ncbi:PQQ-binding-like beta-propeller repeat protein [Halovivax gelatinilyticus]|uniref:outer membrane protein assembly factor BamB family protein n=1 Tax=Halovivax gelatinilyticus TaxID=2961597 RepID=UPI0020CA7F85|nr:PQQ-binding-like beta-propeller repeat protein [Halovivax gelatinilyticus]
MNSIGKSRRAFLATTTGCLAATAGCAGWVRGSNPSFDELAADAPVSVDWAHEEAAAYHSGTNRAFQPVRADDAIAYTTDERIVALDPDDGSVRWRYVDDGYVSSRPVRHDGSLIVGGEQLIALSERTGDVAWSLELDQDSRGFAYETGGIGSTDDILYVGYRHPTLADNLEKPGLARVDLDDREIVDRYDDVHTVLAPLATDDDFAVVVDGDAQYSNSLVGPRAVVAYDSGGPRWRYEFEHPHTRIGPALTSSRVYAASHGYGFDGGSVVAIDRDTGDVEWQAEREVGPSTQTALTVTDDIVTFLDGENQLVALDRDSGDEAWTVAFPATDVHEGTRYASFRTVSAPVVDGDRGYCTNSGALFVIDLVAGEIEWAYADEEAPFSGRPLVGDERLYVPSPTWFFGLEA